MSVYELDDEKKVILEKFRRAMSDLLEPHHNDRFLLRWLKARDFDLQQAEKMLREDFAFRKRMRSDKIIEEYELRKELQPYQTNVFLGFDYEGHAVRLFNIGSLDVKGVLRSMTFNEAVKYTIKVFEEDAKRLEERSKETGKIVGRMTFIADCAGIQIHHFFDKMVLRIMINLTKIYRDHYPETLHVVYLLNVPSMIAYLVNTVILPMLSEVLVQKFKIFGTGDDSWKEEVLSTIPKEIIPGYLGGLRFEPEGDPYCNDLMNWRPKVPTHLYLCHQSPLDPNDSKVAQKLVRERATFEVEREIDVPGAVLSWQFQTKDRNIRFGLFFKYGFPKGRKGSNGLRRDSKFGIREEILPVEVVDSNLCVEKGEYVCERLGTYILHFDNTHSWLRSKMLVYKVEVHQDRPGNDDDGCQDSVTP